MEKLSPKQRFTAAVHAAIEWARARQQAPTGPERRLEPFAEREWREAYREHKQALERLREEP